MKLKNLIRLGEVLHLSKNKNLIIKTNNILKRGIRVVNSNMVEVGTIFEIFGPVKNPYILVKPKNKNPKQYVGKILYALG